MGVTTEEREEMFGYLDGLRETGITNMYGAAPYLANEYDIDKETARSVLGDWMKTFSRDKSPAERAAMCEVSE